MTRSNNTLDAVAVELGHDRGAVDVEAAREFIDRVAAPVTADQLGDLVFSEPFLRSPGLSRRTRPLPTRRSAETLEPAEQVFRVRIASDKVHCADTLRRLFEAHGGVSASLAGGEATGRVLRGSLAAAARHGRDGVGFGTTAWSPLDWRGGPCKPGPSRRTGKTVRSGQGGAPSKSPDDSSSTSR